jgi:hypothetical protein
MKAGSEMQARAVDVRGAGGELYLVRDLLDDQLVDRNHDPMGRVDGLILCVSEGRPPRVAWIESGIPLLAGRVHRRLGRWARAIARRWGLRHGRPARFPWAKVMRVGIETDLDLKADETPALAWEQWLLARVVRHIPSLKPKNKERHQQEEKETQREGKAVSSFGVPPEPTGARESGLSAGTRRVRLHKLLNRQVIDAAGRPAGRVEDVRAHVSGGECLVEEYLLGREALLERLSVPDLSMALLRTVGARHGAGARRVPWREMDLSDPRHPRLRCALEDLPRATPARSTATAASSRTGRS